MTCQNELKSIEDIGKPFYKREQLYFDQLDTSIYVKSKTWGLTGDHSLIVISLDQSYEFYPDSSTEYIIDGVEVFYRQTVDSLIVYYTHMNSIPNQFNTSVKLKFIEIDGPTYRMLNDSFKAGLRKFE